MAKRPAAKRSGRPVPIGEVIREARLKAGMTLRDVERLTGIDPSQLSQIELGKRQDPGFSTTARIAEGLGLSLDALAAKAGMLSKATGGDVKVDPRAKYSLESTNALAEAERHARRTLEVLQAAQAKLSKRRS
jgi:transcriptional regulator with XRE-family HTH domain